ncbi:Hypothetical protein ORPV_720 [Orpheovirus IHUMI-LCC2]|uniref:DUF4304 domain-containing protein n=1 Tax=Orpheovirus IHUMI-LCC2 TaxID=2023057 RepID=A0A2I2L518_9VIRU|nr:Hypothetical protein ORPV_720 [Orpheovirus IHUMI-LCC2]SNW62624.1 Hypothetical protein ORPV_720 [Orpheovirus IHUMI-LCC2]
MEERLIKDTLILQEILQREYDDHRIMVNWGFKDGDLNIKIMYDEDNYQTNVSVIIIININWNNVNWDNQEFEYDVYNYDEWNINSRRITFEEIPDFYPYYDVIDKYKLVKDSRDFKIYKDKTDRLITNISLGLLGYKVEEPELLLNRVLDKYRK